MFPLSRFFALVLLLCACACGPVPETDSGADAASVPDVAPEAGLCTGRASIRSALNGSSLSFTDQATCETWRAQHVDEFPQPCACDGD